MSLDFIVGFVLGYVVACYRQEIKDCLKAIGRAVRDFRKAVAKQLFETLARDAGVKPEPIQPASTGRPAQPTRQTAYQAPPKKTESLL